MYIICFPSFVYFHVRSTCVHSTVSILWQKNKKEKKKIKIGRYHVPLMLVFYLSIVLYALAHKIRSMRYIRRGILLLTISLQSDFYCRWNAIKEQ